METPASLARLRIRTSTGSRGLNATEWALASLVYSHARADHETPVCTRPIGLVAEMLGRRLSKVQDASRTLAEAGYWARVQVSGKVWRWEIRVRPSDDGHRWADHLPESGPRIGGPPFGGGVPGSGVPRSGEGSPDRGVQHQQFNQADNASVGSPDRGTPVIGVPIDPRLVLADAINAQAEHAEGVGRANPPTRMGASTSASGEHQALRQRFQAALSKLEPGPERARLAACGLATPMPEVLRQASDELGGLERVADVLGWAWAEVAAGRLTSFGRAEASTALRDAFRGEGRYWRGILDAYSRRPGEQRALAWRPPDLGDLEPATLDELRMPDWRAAR